jgi:hypothetical protein
MVTVQEGGILDVQGQLLSTTGSVHLLTGGKLTGLGSVHANLHNESGIIAPGSTVGVLSLTGSLDQLDGSLEFELAGTSNADPESYKFDQLVVDGAVSLTGELVVVLNPSFSPSAGDEFPIITATGALDVELNSISLPDLSPGLSWMFDSSDPHVLSLRVVSSLPGDYNSNGIVDAADFTVWRNTLGSVGMDLPADGNGNSVIDQADYIVWRQNFGASDGAASVANESSSIVPELTSLALARIASVLVVLWRIRRYMLPCAVVSLV